MSLRARSVASILFSTARLHIHALLSILSALSFRTPSEKLRFAPSRFQRFTCSLLVILMFSNTALAEPEIPKAVASSIAVSATNYWLDLHFWWHKSGWAGKWAALGFQSPLGSGKPPRGWDGIGAPSRPMPAPLPPDNKASREGKVSKVKIFPGDVTIEPGVQVVFSAIAYDDEDQPVDGLEAKWTGLNEDKNLPLTVSSKATFISAVPGNYKLTADIAGRKAHVKIKVVGQKRVPGLKCDIKEPVSSRDLPKTQPQKIGMNRGYTSAPVSEQVALSSRTRKDKLPGLNRTKLQVSPKAMVVSPVVQSGGDYDYAWSYNNYTTSDDLGTERGDTLGHPPVGSSNFNFKIPVLALDGRGIDLDLSMDYNSRVWHKSGSEMYYDIDKDWLPGWSLGYGKIVIAGSGYMMIEGDGTRHSYNGVSRGSFPSPATSLQTFEGYTTDGSFIDYYAEGY